MGATVTVNGQTVVHKASDGSSTATPDPCWTPPVPIVVAYTNVAYSRDAAATAPTVFADGCAIMIKTSYFSTSAGDEPGTGGGVISGVNRGKATFTNYSFDVFAEGENVPRRHDPMGQNHGSPYNAFSPAESQPNLQTWIDVICIAICLCHWLVGAPVNLRNAVLKGMKLGRLAELLSEWNPFERLMSTGKQACVDSMLSVPRVELIGGVYRDRLLPNIHPEVPFDMTTTPPSAMMSSKRSAFHRDAAGNPQQLPRPYPGWWLTRRAKGTTRIPDIIITHNPRLPPTGNNIARVVEIKFPGDTWGVGQKEAYREIDPLQRNPLELSPKACGCELELTPEELLALAASLAILVLLFTPWPDDVLIPALASTTLPLLARFAPSLVPLIQRAGGGTLSPVMP
ncbi:PAAR-like domain-containing protein [Sorangium sp. So ce1182]|uniref:PAAR-like domain-containing protein n=1 Tax=Sorangium sp. So ce1182 TaxID=3133334 RepID=UPI003F60C1A7